MVEIGAKKNKRAVSNDSRRMEGNTKRGRHISHPLMVHGWRPSERCVVGSQRTGHFNEATSGGEAIQLLPVERFLI